MRIDADVAIVGSGFAGSLTALALRRLGHRVVLIERGRHPRFTIGESSTPLANLLLEELADEYDLPQIRPFAKWGTWQRARPDIAGGLKRGFSFYFHQPGEAFSDDESHRRQLLVAASPHDEIGDTHWFRSDFDWNLVREAQALGAVYLDDTDITRVAFAHSRATLEGRQRERAIEVQCSFVIDASGPRGFLVRALGLETEPLHWLPPTEAIYTHFENVARFDTEDPTSVEGRRPPYPPDDAALHHVFPGGWIWVLRFNNGITSAGAALTAPVAKRVRAGDCEAAWVRLLDELPSIRDQFARARAVQPWVHLPRVAFRTNAVCGANWALLPSAVGAIDPLLSTGFPLTLLGVHRVLKMLQVAPGPFRQAARREYECITRGEFAATELLIAALYASMHDASLFKRLTLLYFAAVSFSEAARRLRRPASAPGFLLHAHPQFGPELRECCEAGTKAPTGADRDALLSRIDRAIEPFDVAGLRDRSRADWYPALASDLVAAAAKLHASPQEVQGMLQRCGFTANSGGAL